MGGFRKMISGTIYGTCEYIKDVEFKKRRHSLFKCDCGIFFESRTSHVVTGKIKSCGCIRGKNLINYYKNNPDPKITHGYTIKNHHPIYNIWNMMRDRCNNPKNKSYKNYGARGIRVCDRWLKSFKNFLYDMGERPSKYHSLDRIDNEQGYFKDNCRWALSTQQSRNTRVNRMIIFNGKIQPLCDWVDELKISRSNFYKRIKLGWSIDEIFNYKDV